MRNKMEVKSPYVIDELIAYSLQQKYHNHKISRRIFRHNDNFIDIANNDKHHKYYGKEAMKERLRKKLEHSKAISSPSQEAD